jgi:hypothetical protein
MAENNFSKKAVIQPSETRKNYLELHSGYSEAMVVDVKAIPGAKWNKGLRVWEVHKKHEQKLRAAVRPYFDIEGDEEIPRPLLRSLVIQHVRLVILATTCKAADYTESYKIGSNNYYGGSLRIDGYDVFNAAGRLKTATTPAYEIVKAKATIEIDYQGLGEAEFEHVYLKPDFTKEVHKTNAKFLYRENSRLVYDIWFKMRRDAQLRKVVYGNPNLIRPDGQPIIEMELIGKPEPVIEMSGHDRYAVEIGEFEFLPALALDSDIEIED